MIYTTDALLKLLTELRTRIQEGDSLKGNLTYSCMEAGLEPGEWDVSGSFRVECYNAQPAIQIIPVPRNRSKEAPTKDELLWPPV
jgi:hypothetical protein